MDAGDERRWLGYPASEWAVRIFAAAVGLAVYLWVDVRVWWALGALVLLVGAIRLLSGLIACLLGLILGRP